LKDHFEIDPLIIEGLLKKVYRPEIAENYFSIFVMTKLIRLDAET